MHPATLILAAEEAEAMAQQCEARGLHDEALGARTVAYRLTELFERAIDARCKNMEAA